jgi:aerobic carbon-monoxide dehydrogenase small subunit
MTGTPGQLGGRLHARDAEQIADIELTVNGVKRVVAVSTRRLLSDLLRHDLGLTGTHVGCEHGVCGACTVLVDGSPARSCLLLAVQCAGGRVVTIEGLSPADGSLSRVQAAFKEAHGLQCGFCTPGFVVAVTALIDELDPGQTLSDEQIREHIAGNLCRCTGYQSIVQAVSRILTERCPPRASATDATCAEDET